MTGSRQLRARGHATADLLVALSWAMALTGCTTAPSDVATADASVPTASSPASESAAAPEALMKIADCDEVGGYLGELVVGLEPSLSAVDTVSALCDWGGAQGEPFVSVEALTAGNPAVPSREVVEASGGRIIDSPAVQQAGGVVYALPGFDGQAYSLLAILPEFSASVTVVDAEVGTTQLQQMARAMESMLRLHLE